VRILIEFSETKREIDGGFMICGSRADLRHIAHQILNAAAEEFSYGWITIYPEIPVSNANTPPQPWDRAHWQRKGAANAGKT
jgi:hypothetical protein